jgi:signal transduction histidine kinase
MQNYAIFARLFTGATLITTWAFTGTPLLGVVFALVLTALSAVRYRFNPYKWLIPSEIIICFVYAYFWLPSLLGLWLPIISFMEEKWIEWEKELLLKDFKDRTERLKLERERGIASYEAAKAVNLAEINERARIAQDIHDHVGHEIAGALIALQTTVTLYENNDSRTGEFLTQTIKRLESASENLRDTVHNLKPAKEKLSLLEICESFKFCNIELDDRSELSNIKHKEILAANLKEALTNVSRHSDSTLVTVRLDENENYIRMTIADNGKFSGTPRFGLGLSGMKERVRVANGTLTVNTDSGFRIICVLPKGDRI